MTTGDRLKAEIEEKARAGATVGEYTALVSSVHDLGQLWSMLDLFPYDPDIVDALATRVEELGGQPEKSLGYRALNRIFLGDDEWARTRIAAVPASKEPLILLARALLAPTGPEEVAALKQALAVCPLEPRLWAQLATSAQNYGFHADAERALRWISEHG